jgi:hypothetical protein
MTRLELDCIVEKTSVEFLNDLNLLLSRNSTRCIYKSQSHQFIL